MEGLMDWLPRNIPPGDETCIVHGDYRIDNLIYDLNEPRAIALLDWEMSTLGHPLVDFAYHCMTWRLPPNTFPTLQGLDLAAAGIPSEDEYVAAYCRRTGRPQFARKQWEFYIIFGMFRLAAILQGIAKRAQQGNASSQEAVAMGALARPLSEEAWACVERLGRIG
jgi:aminoglycoside phosphotransferase (APT) family kinase protein